MSGTECSRALTVLYIDHVFRLSSYVGQFKKLRTKQQTDLRRGRTAMCAEITISCVMSDSLSARNGSASLWNDFDQILYLWLLLKFHYKISILVKIF